MNRQTKSDKTSDQENNTGGPAWTGKRQTESQDHKGSSRVPLISQKISGASPQPKLDISDPDDRYEREADRVAGEVMRRSSPDHFKSLNRIEDQSPTKRSQNAERKNRQKYGILKGNGQPLPKPIRSYFEPRFEQDFSEVRVHTGTRASEMAKRINARAFTQGHDIGFRDGEYNPHTREGRRMLAHELTHVLQQQRAPTPDIQRQPSVFEFHGCSSDQFDIIDRTIRQSFLMVRHAINTLITVIGLILTQQEDQQLSDDVRGVVNAAEREFGAGDTSTLSDIRDRYITIREKYKQGLDITCHNDSSRNQVAEASTPGNEIWLGPKFFQDKSDHLSSRPRIFIHEVAHNTGLEHAFPGLALVAGESAPAGVAQVAHGADGYALFAYRIYTRQYRAEVERDDDI